MPRKVENENNRNLKTKTNQILDKSDETKMDTKKHMVENSSKPDNLRVDSGYEKLTDNKQDQEKRVNVSLKEKKLNMITTHFEPKEMLAFSQLRTLNQKDLLNSLDQNDKLGIVIKDKLQVAMINMEKYQNLVEAVHEYIRLLEWLEEQELFKQQLQTRLNTPVWEELPAGKSLLEWTGLD